MPDEKEAEVIDALANASALYATYVTLAKLAEIPAPPPEPATAYEYSWDHPLGLKITTTG
jgi:hypothetical protein